ncbi:MAG: hypothetical protein PHS14_00240 [Elusimicrobia bacterium]|nr:hypothetical protein [Elusimicrobiota bacterium]
MGFSTSLAQSDTLRLNNQVISTFANEDCGKLEFPNELIMVDVDKQGNGLLAINQKGLIADLDVRLVMAADDDQYLNSLLAQQTGGSPTIISGVLTKNFADQTGKVTSVQVQLNGGAFLRGIPMMISTGGNIEQTVSVYKLRFANWLRLIL